MRKVRIIDKVLNIPLKNEIGDFYTGAYKILNSLEKIEEIIILYYGELKNIKNVRINSACYTGDLFHCNRCDCHEQLENAMKYFVEQGNGMLLYILQHDGRGLGTVNKLKSLLEMDQYHLSTKHAFEKLGLDPDERNYSSVVAILNDLGINDINLLTNNPDKIELMNVSGINVVKQIPLICIRDEIKEYLKSKHDDFNHAIEV